MFKKIILWIAVIFMSMVIFGFSSNTGDESSQLSVGITEAFARFVNNIVELDSDQLEKIFEVMHVIVRKSAHFTEFAILGILSWLLAKSYGLSLRLCAVLALAYCLLFAVCDEMHQLFVDGRAGRISDVLIDFSGSATGVGLCFFGRFIKKKM